MADYQGTYTIDFQEAERMSQLLAKYPAIAGDELAQAMNESVSRVTKAVQRFTPLYSTKLRQSIVGRVETSILGAQAPSITGTIATDLVYALPVEVGRRPGSLPPREPLIRWAAVVLGDGDAGDAVRWAIFKRGTKGKFMFARGWRDTRGWVSERFKRALGQIVKRLASNG